MRFFKTRSARNTTPTEQATDQTPPIRSDVLLAAQRALLGEITPQMRAVTVDLSAGIRLRFVYAGAFDDDQWETANDVETEMLADLRPGHTIDTVIESDSHGPVTYSETEIGVFRRRDRVDQDPASPK